MSPSAFALEFEPFGGALAEASRPPLARGGHIEPQPPDRAEGLEALMSLLLIAPQLIQSNSGGESASHHIDAAAGPSAACVAANEFPRSDQFPAPLGVQRSNPQVAASAALRHETLRPASEPLLEISQSPSETPATTVEQMSGDRISAKFEIETRPAYPTPAQADAPPSPATMLDAIQSDASQSIAAPPAEKGPSTANPLERSDPPAGRPAIDAETFARLQAFRDQTSGVARVVQHDARRIELLLNPPDLGKVAVDLTVGEADVVKAVVTGESPEALRFMRGAAEAIRDAMSASADIRFEFREDRADAQDSWRDSDHRALRIEHELEQTRHSLVIAAPAAKPATSRLDLRV